MRKQQGGSKHSKTKYDRFCHGLSEEEVKERVDSGEPYVIRMLIPRGKTEHKDIIHGKIVFDNDSVDDQVIMKGDGYPTYHFANVVDDYLMRITHVIRGEEWLPSVPKHLLLYKMLEIDPPQFAHLPLMLNMKGQKLSKRHGDVSVQEYRDQGYLPEALLNGLALLGWNPPQHEDANVLSENINAFLRSEVMSIKDMELLFNINKVGKSGVKFEQKKLEYLNSMHIRDQFNYYESEEDKKMCTDEWRKVLLATMPSELSSKIRAMSDFKMTSIMDMMKIRIHFYSDLLNHTYFFQDPSLDTKQGKKTLSKLKNQPHAVKAEILQDLITLFQAARKGNDSDMMSREDVNKVCSMYLFENRDRNFKNEDVFFLLRYAVSGNPVGAPTGDICQVIGYSAVIQRCKNAIDFLRSLNDD